MAEAETAELRPSEGSSYGQSESASGVAVGTSVAVAEGVELTSKPSVVAGPP